ncbi:flagellar biosynthesis protein FlhF [Amphibacillus sp. MSJ-3]|uniref:flagellar biosynthesis protein FlhF n=1 Tax=Amphibacillus sp. MSJ-3 TaxID=2841505 RepID=UPI001C0F25BB|nr:flagellar biosynthesis protein FlhF [Amphibacillus sp. MSJ-3]MBU5594976.1 flagellar biosynthesis protein FlhF [Amphibacillus sp. MSJ-3]
MKVRKYIAPSMPEALEKVRNEFGEDAVILSSKVIYTGGFLGLFKKRNIEVVAAYEPRTIKPSSIEKQQTNIQYKNKFPELGIDKQQQIVLEELRSLRKWMEKTTDHSEKSFPVAFQSVKELLIHHEVENHLADQVIANVLQQVKQTDLTFQEAKQVVKQYLVELFTQFNCGAFDYQKKFIHLVGPTGVGKTTTIAKLAANSMIKDGKKVALITTDTYRIAAIEQLKTYSNILDIPLEIAYTMEDYQKARLKFQEYDLVFVDTAGRNFRDPKYIAELGKVVDLEHDIETYLVLSLTTKARDLTTLFNQFKNIPIKRLIFTKTDETSSYGAILNLVYERQIGIAYLTNGQNVPDDINKATPTLLANLLMKLDDDHD